MTTTGRLIACLLFVLAFAGCGGCTQAGPCTEDAQCDPTGEGFQGCDETTGICICLDDRGCEQTEICNALGRCQTIAGCTTNEDCGGTEGLFCDTISAQCLSVQECNPADGQLCCTQDSQCPFRQICDTLTLSCVPGCRDSGDCILGEGCVGAGFGTTGQCGTACTDDTLCPAQHLCNLSEGVCELDTRGPYCLGCPLGGDGDCGAFNNYCLVDQVNGGGFCGVDCQQSGEASCPSSYECVDVVVVLTTHQCTFPEDCLSTGVCSRTGGPCASPQDCPQGPPLGDCRDRTGKAGSCELNPNQVCERDSDCADGTCILHACVGSEGDNFGFCTCTRDADCFDDRCLDADPDEGRQGHCEISGHPCFDDLDCDIITCIEGGCRIGKNCVPSSGRTCRDVLPTTDP